MTLEAFAEVKSVKEPEYRVLLMVRRFSREGREARQVVVVELNLPVLAAEISHLSL